MDLTVLGTGVLGKAIAERFLATQHHVIVYNRTREKTAALADLGASVAATPEEAVSSARTLVLVLADDAAIRSVLLNPPVRRNLAGRTVIQMGTIGAMESTTLSKEVKAHDGDYLEAPVLGSVAEAKAGSLLIMVGSTPEQFMRWLPFFQVLGQDVRHAGPVGTAAILKLALNQLIAAETTAFGLSLGLIRRAGIPVDTFMALLRKSALYAPTFDKKLPRLLERKYEQPNFSTRHLLKDLDLILRGAGGGRRTQR